MYVLLPGFINLALSLVPIISVYRVPWNKRDPGNEIGKLGLQDRSTSSAKIKFVFFYCPCYCSMLSSNLQLAKNPCHELFTCF